MKPVTPKKAQKLTGTLLIAGTVVMLLGYYTDRIFYAGLVVALSSLIPHFLWNRCPYCEKLLGRTGGSFCPYCGKPIDREEWK